MDLALIAISTLVIMFVMYMGVWGSGGTSGLLDGESAFKTLQEIIENTT